MKTILFESTVKHALVHVIQVTCPNYEIFHYFLIFLFHFLLEISILIEALRHWLIIIHEHGIHLLNNTLPEWPVE